MGNAVETEQIPSKDDPEFENYFVNRQGKYLYTRKYLPEENVPIKAIIILAHGLFGHSGRQAYITLASFLTPKGFAIYALDHLGHGKSQGLRAYVDNFDYYCDDLGDFVNIVTQKHGKNFGKPFLLGHSMGGAIALQMVLRDQSVFQGLILNGPAIWLHNDENYTFMIKTAAKLTSVVLPAQAIDYENIYALSRNIEACDAYARDPLVCTSVGCRSIIAAELIRASEELHKNWKKLNIPFLVFHGSCDVTCSSLGSVNLHNDAESTDKTIKILEGFFHEPWEDPEKEMVFETIAKWLEERLPKKGDD